MICSNLFPSWWLFDISISRMTIQDRPPGWNQREKMREDMAGTNFLVGGFNMF